MGVRKVYSARSDLVRCALRYQAAVMYNEEHSDDPHSDSQLELREEMLDKAVNEYVAATCALANEAATDV